MDNVITIIKTLPHLISLFLPKDTLVICAMSYSEDVLKILKGAYALDKHQITFSDLLQKATNVSSHFVNNAYLDKYKQEIVTFQRVESVERLLDFSVKGDIISIWPIGYEYPVRLEFFGERCDQLYVFDAITGRKIRDIHQLVLTTELPADRGSINELRLINYGLMSENNIEKMLFTNKNISGIQTFHNDFQFDIQDSDFRFPPLYFSNTELIRKDVEKFQNDGYTIAIATKHERDIPKALRQFVVDGSSFKPGTTPHSILTTNDSELIDLPAGFVSDKQKLLFLTDRELFGSIYLNKVKTEKSTSSRVRKLLAQFEGEITIGDYVVHQDYGIGIYSGLQSEEYDGSRQDYLVITYANNDEIYVPLTQIEKITKYLGNSDIPPKLTKLSQGGWKKLTQRIKKTTYLLAKELLEHLAKREVSKALTITKVDSEEYKAFLAKFPYEETHDQLIALREILGDLESEKPMNRLLVGDVGFGKTEVMMRAAFKIVENGGQVVVLSPTTVLTAQHDHVFHERFRDTAVSIASVSRFNTVKENKRIIDQANKGAIDIIIGTHRLLSSDVQLKHLHLLVVDEEQKFGVKQKEKIKRINYGAHLLSVSATPIPRTLGMALSSIQDISVITTPPKGRKPVETEIIYSDWNKVASAVQEEIHRGGQVYFLHNRVETIQATQAKLQSLLPGITFKVAHGQMSSTELDTIMTGFYLHKFDVLISTTIIENGLDLSNVNTIIIDQAHKFGLSQLYQLRGRVGRGASKAYCYLLAPQPKKIQRYTEEAIDSWEFLKKQKDKKESEKLYMQRLQSLVDNTALGSGFQIASKDLEIRGAGTVLGEKQHGHITQIGYALYIEMLTKEIEKIKAETDNAAREK